MVTVLKNEPASPSRKESGGHRMDSSHLLRALLMFARSGSDEESGNVQSLGGVISVSVLRSLLSSLHHRDAATVRHSRRVAKLVVGMAHYLGWDGPQQKVLEVAALLHDIGKIGVPDNILFKPGKLNPDEADMMALHYRVGLDVLQACKVDQQVLDMIRYSYSYVDIASESCTAACLHSHQGSRILAVADAYDSLSTDQVYRPAKPHNEVMRVLQEASGTRFDGNVVSALLRWIDGNGLPAAGEQEIATPAASTAGNLNPEEAAEITTIGNIFSYLFVLESLYDGFYLVDGGMRFCIWNRGCEKIFGKSAADILGTLWSSEAVSYNNAKGKQLPDAANPTHRVITEAKPLTSTVFVKSPEGETIEVEVQSLPLFDPQARLQGVAEIIRGLGHTKHHPREYRELKLAASRDALTSVANRRELESKLAGLFLHYTKSSDVEPFSVIFLDIDFFKNINDTFGHTVGDDVLIDLAKLLQQEMYSGEIVGRYGGEEFVILCPQTNLKQALSRAERLRSALPAPSSIAWGITRSPRPSALPRWNPTMIWRRCSNGPTRPFTWPRNRDATAPAR